MNGVTANLLEPALRDMALAHLRQYGFPEITLLNFELLHQKNSTSYLFHTSQGKFVVQIKPDDVRPLPLTSAIAYQHYLFDCGMPVAKPIGPAVKLENHGADNGKIMQIVRFIELETLQQRPDYLQPELLGRDVARLHLAGSDYYPADQAPEPSNDLFSWELARRYAAMGKDYAHAVFTGRPHVSMGVAGKTLAHFVLANMADIIARRQDRCWPGGMIHADLHNQNILVDDAGNSSFIDFDLTHRGNFAEELSWCVHYLFFESAGRAWRYDRQGIVDFMRDYHKIRPLEAGEAKEVSAQLLRRTRREDILHQLAEGIRPPAERESYASAVEQFSRDIDLVKELGIVPRRRSRLNESWTR